MSAPELHEESLLAHGSQPMDDADSGIGDGSSSLSDIENDAEHDEQDEPDDADDVESDESSEEDENDSEAETERLHPSPDKNRVHRDVVMGSDQDAHTFERQPSNLHNEYTLEEDDEEEEDDVDDDADAAHAENNEAVDDGSDDELSLPASPQESLADDAAEDAEETTVPLKPASYAPAAPKDMMHAFDLTNKKRKRSQIVDRGALDPEELGEPSRKRTGSVLGAGDDYAIDDNAHDDLETPNDISAELSDIDSIDMEDEDNAEEEAAEDAVADDEADKALVNGRPLATDEAETLISDDRATATATDAEADAIQDVEVDDAEVALKDEEEQEKKRVAFEQLGDIEKHFSSFRNRLHEDRLARLEREEGMLKQDPPVHPEYLAMMQCIDARRDNRIRLEERRVEYNEQTINKTAVARRAQILSQFYQEVRAIREKKLEQLGKQWYEIQHDRRAYGENVKDYVLSFPTKRNDQLKNQIAYNTEVSVLSGIAKYRGFPAAPSMAPATAEEREADLKAMGKLQSERVPRRAIVPNLPMQDIAAIRAAASAAALNPAEEQFIEQTPWANPKHPSHAHLLQRQAGHQGNRNSSPFGMVAAQQSRKHSGPAPGGLPVSGTFSGVGGGSMAHTHAVPGARRPLNEYGF